MRYEMRLLPFALPSMARWIVTIVVVCSLVACVFGRDIVNHSYGFDVSSDNQDAEVLDFQYGESKNGTRASEESVKRGRTYQGTTIVGPMLRGDFLYVKWRIKSTGAVYEDRVDLRHRLPRNIERHRVTFMVRGPQLYVYLVSPEKRPPETPPLGPRMYQHEKVTQIYPNSNHK